MQNQQLVKTNTKLNRMNGELNLYFEKKGMRTKLTRSHHSSPLKSSKALYMDEDGTATVYLMETSGGMVEGDSNYYDISVTCDSHVSLIPQSATKVYPSRLDLPCRQSIKLIVEDQASLKWLPETIIPFENSIFHGNTKIKLHSHSSLLYSEIFSSGRQKSDESFEFNHFSSKTLIYVDEKLVVYDHLNVKKESSPIFQLGMFEDYTYMGTLWYIAPLATKGTYEEVSRDFNEGECHRFGFTNIDHYGVHFRWLSNDLCLVKNQMTHLIHYL
ncbi:urease accessory protein UreD [Halalkalibacter lacteus]|uniref:urease accessory protein UreD n=1 Tax=Halalkalibacter lacteus TaxID=3090663 RepID=UPI002FC90D18